MLGLSSFDFYHDFRHQTAQMLPLLKKPAWLRGKVVERRSLKGELSLSHARPVADE